MAEARYQDYVIKDGKFVGKFEEMYRKFNDPWHQIEAEQNSYDRHSTILSLKRLESQEVLEVGCGLGYFTNYLSQNLPEINFTGMDISETAIEKAKGNFPSLNFITGNCADSL